MGTFSKIIITAGCYILVFLGFYLDAIWAMVGGAFMAGLTTTMLIVELRVKKKDSQ